MTEQAKEWRLSGRAPGPWEIHGPGFVEAICPHGVGHHKGVHGCHFSSDDKTKSCCENCPEELWAQVTEE